MTNKKTNRPLKIEEYHDYLNRLYNYPYDIKKEKNKIQCPNITFQVTDACNLACTYCYQINKSNHIMPIEIAQKFIDMLLENNNNTQQYIDTKASNGVILEFIGGEPFLQIELIDQIIEYFIKRTIETNHPWQYNWRLSISSNGILYFEPKVQKFFDKYMDKLSFGISIDGNKQLHDACRIFPNGDGSYDQAISAVQHFINIRKGKMGSKMTLAPQNIQYTCDAIIGLINQGYEEILLNCIFEKGWTNEHATILYYQLKQLTDYLFSKNLENKIYISIFEENNFHPKKIEENENWCGGNGFMLAIDWKGDIYPCIRYMESSLGKNIEPIKIGNINDGIMTDAKCYNCINKLKQVNRINQSTQECIECPIAEGCSWCQAYNYQDSGTFFHRATYICCMHKACSLANYYFWNLYYKKYNENKKFKLYLSDRECLKIISENELYKLKNI